MEMGIFGFAHSEGQVEYIFPMEKFSDLFGEVNLFYLFSRQGCWSTQKFCVLCKTNGRTRNTQVL